MDVIPAKAGIQKANGGLPAQSLARSGGMELDSQSSWE